LTGASPIPARPLRVAEDGWSLEILDQTRLPHEVVVVRLTTLDDVVEAIAVMRVRGAPLLGITAAYGLALALRADPSDHGLRRAAKALVAARPTAVNLPRAVEVVSAAVADLPSDARAAAAYAAAGALAEEEVTACRAIGDHGLRLLLELAAGRPPGQPVRVLTHCNTGWLATLEYGTALAPVYRAAEENVPVHVWVDETRPRNQGWLTAWELHARGVPHTLIPDSAAAHLLQRGEVDVVLVGTDRTTRRGDVCNKIGTYPLALAARAARVPFYAAVPSSSVDWSRRSWRRIPIEERSPAEVRRVRGRLEDGMIADVHPGRPETEVRNPAFDVTPARLVTGLLTERGVCAASAAGLEGLFPERRR
jgi:methylthioribose-1-phosphate isomerase